MVSNPTMLLHEKNQHNRRFYQKQRIIAIPLASQIMYDFKQFELIKGANIVLELKQGIN